MAAESSGAASPLVLDALVLQHLHQRFPQAAEALRKELDARQAEQPQPAVVAPKQRQALLTLLASANRDEPMWATSYAETRDWIDGALDLYKPELQRLLYPLFAYTYLALVGSGERGHAGSFFERFHGEHTLHHRQEVNFLSQVNTPEQLRTHEYSRRLLRQRYELRLSAFTHALLVGFVEERRQHIVLRLLNEHVRIRMLTISPPAVSAAGGGAEAAEAEAHGGALLWAQVDATELASFNSTPIQWGALPELQKKHRELLHQLRQRQGLVAPDEPLPPDPKDGKRRGRKAAAMGDADIGAPASARAPRLPLPPFNPKVEKDYVRDAARCARLAGGEPPLALAWTVIDTAPPATLCCMTFSNDGASAACGHGDGAVRVCLMKQLTAAPAGKKAKQAGRGREGGGGEEATEGGKEASGGEANGAGEAVTDGGGGAAAAGSGATDTSAELEAEIASRVAEAEAEPIFSLIGHSGPVYGVGWSRDDKFIISASQDGTARLWSVLQRACIVRYHAHTTACWSVCFCPVGAYFATTGADRTVRFWAVSQRSPLRVLMGHASDATCATFHPAGAILASGGDDAAVRIWDLSGAKCLRLLVAAGHAAAVRALAFSPGGAQLCSAGDDRAVLLWDLPSAAVLRRFRLHTKPVWTVGFSADGAQLVSAGPDCMVGVWDVCGMVEGAPPATAPPASAAAGNAAGGATGDAAGLDASVGGAGEAEGADGDALADPRLVQVIFTKFTPVVAAAYSRTNVLYVGGAFCPPEGYKERMVKQKRGGRPGNKG